MKLGSIRELEGNRPVLMDENASGPNPVYWVFSDVSRGRWANVTLITPGLYTSAALSAGGEFPKTFGHYHGTKVDETYHLIEGEGVLQLQKKYIENGKWIKDRVEKVYLIKAKPGDEILITPEWGHSWSNVGEGPLISFDDWRSGHKISDYEDIKSLQGLSFYLVKEEGKIKAIKNPNYKDLPEPIWISASEFKASLK